jgi:hypothetical protein
MELNLSNTIAWNPVSGAVDYEVILINHDDVPTTTNIIGQLLSGGATAVGANALIGGAIDGQGYGVYVRAVDAQGRAGDWSDGLIVTVKLAPAKVTGLVIS